MNLSKVLGLTSSASQEEISTKHKELVKKWHPDKVRTNDPKEKKNAEQKFMQIQQAYERLSSIHDRRSKRKTEL